MDNDVVQTDTENLSGDNVDTVTPPAPVDGEKDYKQMWEDQKVRAEKAEAKFKQAEQPVADVAQTNQPDQPSAKAFDEKAWDLKTDLKMAGYSAEEIRFIQSNAPNGNIVEAVETKSGKLTPKDEFVHAGIMAQRKKAQVEQGTQPPSKRASVDSAVKTFKETDPKERAAKYSPQAWRERQEG